MSRATLYRRIRAIPAANELSWRCPIVCKRQQGRGSHPDLCHMTPPITGRTTGRGRRDAAQGMSTFVHVSCWRVRWGSVSGTAGCARWLRSPEIERPRGFRLAGPSRGGGVPFSSGRRCPSCSRGCSRQRSRPRPFAGCGRGRSGRRRCTWPRGRSRRPSRCWTRRPGHRPGGRPGRRIG